MNLKNIYPLIILLDAFENAALTVILGVNYLGFLAHIAMKNCISLFIKKRKSKAFTAANIAPGFTPDQYSLNCLKKQNNPGGNHNHQPPSANNLTKLPAPYYPQSIATDLNTATSPEPSAKPNIIHGNIITPGATTPPSNLGRWCERCQDYKIFARLERVGNSAHNVRYIPHCISCGSVLASGKSDSGF